jgi:hypothetical protein
MHRSVYGDAIKGMGAEGHGIYLCYEVEQSGRHWQREKT